MVSLTSYLVMKLLTPASRYAGADHDDLAALLGTPPIPMYNDAILRRVKGKRGKEITMYKIGKFTFDTQKQTLIIGEAPTTTTWRHCWALRPFPCTTTRTIINGPAADSPAAGALKAFPPLRYRSFSGAMSL